MEEPKRSLGLTTKIIALVVTVITVVVAVNYVVFVNGYRNDAERAMMDKAAAFTAVADEAKTHASKQIQAGAVDTETLIAEAVDHMESGGNYSDTRFFNVIPVVVGWTTAQNAAQKEGIDFSVPAFDARNPDNEPAPGGFRAELLRDLENQIASGGDSFIGRINRDTNTLHYMRAIQLDKSCMMCHGDPAIYDADGDGKDPLGFAMENWDIGDTHGAYEVAMPLATTDEQVAGFIGSGLMFSVPLVVAGLGGVIIGLRFLMTKPLMNLVGAMKEIATGDGDLTKRINLTRGDEIGRLAHWFDAFVDGIHNVIKEVSGSSNEVASAATEIAASTEEMAGGMSQQQNQTRSAAAAVEELDRSVTDIAEQASQAAAASQSAQDRAREGGEVVGRAVSEIRAIADEVDGSAKAVSSLGARSEQIGGVIEVINDIADQTNLLALNAAIEAARAGEHGRGFAVVADEVRKLAERTTTATDEVAQSIRQIQEETAAAVTRIESGSQRMTGGVELAEQAGTQLTEIVSSSGQLLDRVQSIAAAAEQQSAAATEIGRSVQEVADLSRTSASGADQAAAAASQLSRQSERMRELIERFKI